MEIVKNAWDEITYAASVAQERVLRFWGRITPPWFLWVSAKKLGVINVETFEAASEALAEENKDWPRWLQRGIDLEGMHLRKMGGVRSYCSVKNGDFSSDYYDPDQGSIGGNVSTSMPEYFDDIPIGLRMVCNGRPTKAKGCNCSGNVIGVMLDRVEPEEG